jgi:flavin-dependent dehydrogenase
MSGCEVIVVGAGPAGSALACLLAERGINTILIEEKRMPREKLCGAFITPECFPTLHRIGALEKVIAAGAQRISELRLVAPTGQGVTTTISAISASGGNCGLSLSRSRFDGILMDRARRAGAVLLEGMAVKRGLFKDGRVGGVECVSLPTGVTRVFEAPLIVDASGRNSRLSLSPSERTAGRKGGRLYALKAHLENVSLPSERVELYFFPTGYGGLSRVENGLVNLCFITSERSIKEGAGDAVNVVRQTLMRNPGARQRLSDARVVGKWLSAGPLFFGHRRLVRNGIIAVGDAAGMIDPFTGTGIQIALRSSEILADTIINDLANRDSDRKAALPESPSGLDADGPANLLEGVERVRKLYETRYQAEFRNRMAVAGVFRLAAFSPRAAGLVATLFARAPSLAEQAFKGTRLGRRCGQRADAEFNQIMELSPPYSVSNDEVGITSGR